jgi:hypothetical protein
MSKTAIEIEQMMHAACHGTPIGVLAELMKDSETSFDMNTASKDLGAMIGLEMANEAPDIQAGLVARLMRYRGHDPADDAEAIGHIRSSCVTIRKFLNDDAVARQFARLVAHHALTVYVSLIALADKQRAGTN